MSGVRKLQRFKRHWMRLRARIALPSLLAGYEERTVVALFAAVSGGMSLLIIGTVAWLIDVPLLFPALGPTAFLFFSHPFAAASAPRSVILGHGTAIAAGWVVWRCTGLLSGQVISPEAGGLPVYISASVTLAVTCVLLIVLSCPHAPACSTALIIAVGAAGTWIALAGIIAGVVLLTGQAVAIERLANVNVPIWSPRRADPHSS